MQPRWRFLMWLTALASLWVFANWPKNLGPIKSFLEFAGFPWVFARWDYGRLTPVRTMLAADVGLGAAFALGLAALCVWSQRRNALPD